MTTQTLTKVLGLGCELRCVGGKIGTSDKSYRFVLAHDVVVAQWGRHQAIAGRYGYTGGQTLVHRFGTPGEAAVKVRELIGLRQKHGYGITNEPFKFETDAATAQAFDGGRAALAAYLDAR